MSGVRHGIRCIVFAKDEEAAGTVQARARVVVSVNAVCWRISARDSRRVIVFQRRQEAVGKSNGIGAGAVSKHKFRAVRLSDAFECVCGNGELIFSRIEGEEFANVSRGGIEGDVINGVIRAASLERELRGCRDILDNADRLSEVLEAVRRITCRVNAAANRREDVGSGDYIFVVRVD